jgi:hypothetical protein
MLFNIFYFNKNERNLRKKILSLFFFTLGHLAQFDDCFYSSIFSLNSATRNIIFHLLSYTTHTHQVQ